MVQADLCRQLAMNLSQGYFLYFQSTPEHPDFAPFENSVFMLQPNPDAVYHYAPVSGSGTYRIVGERGSVPVAGFCDRQGDDRDGTATRARLRQLRSRRSHT